MNTGTLLKHLPESATMTQKELADRVHVTRQAVSRGENDETLPSSETLLALSALFGVSVDVLLDLNEVRYCECCGMPIEPSIMGKNTHGETDPRYCKWCLPEIRILFCLPVP